VFENRVLRGIFCPKNVEVTGRKDCKTGEACRTYVGEEMCVEGFGKEMCIEGSGKET